MKKNLVYSFVIPIFNEEACLYELFQRMSKTINSLKEPSEVILVDDGSRDNSYTLLCEQNKKDERFKIIKLSRNFGHQNAVTAGMKVSSGQAVIVMDADLQDPPEVVFSLIEKWKDGTDIVHAIRKTREGETWFKLFTAKMFYKFLGNISDIEVVRNAGDFRLYDRKTVDVLNSLEEKERFIRGLSCWVGFKQTCVLYERKERTGGETKYTLKKMVNLATSAITSFSDWPLRLIFKLGIAISFLSFCALLYIVYLRIFTESAILGWSSIMAIIVFFNGILVTMLGVIGVYIGHLFKEIKGRPGYVIDYSSSTISDPENKKVEL